MNSLGIFCNRTLNLRSIQAIGYDMDYTLIHYDVAVWENRAYEYLRDRLVAQGWPVADLKFDPDLVCRGLVIDIDKGNLIKANRFGFVKQALHGTRPLGFDLQRELYSRIIVDVSESRWVFLHTLFSLSEGCMYAQLVELLDAGKLPESLGYRDLYSRVRENLDAAHAEGRLKAEIVAAPERFVQLDEEIPLTLLDQKNSGKKLMLITNSEWSYTAPMMSYAFDRFLPEGSTWRDLFDTVIVSAKKPEFFTTKNPFFEVMTADGLLKPFVGDLRAGAVYFGGSARQLEKHMGITGDEFLYVGDHMFGDVEVTKSVLRWRTALILRELEEEVHAADKFRPKQQLLVGLMQEKEALEAQACQVRVQLQRKRKGYGPAPTETEESLQVALDGLRQKIEVLDHRIAPLAKSSTELGNPNWGPLMRAGNDKSLLAFQMERYADIYTARVSFFLRTTPFIYLRSPRGSLPHD